VVSDDRTIRAGAGRAAGANDAAAPIRIPAKSWYALAVLTLISLFSYMDRTAISILLEPIKVDLGLNDSQLGLLSGMAFVALYAILGLPLARLADRSSRVRLLTICFAVWSAMTTLCGVARNFPELFLARMGVGVGEAGCYPPAHSLIADYFPRERRAVAIGILQAGAAVGGSIGLFFIGLLGEELGWRAALQIVGLAGAPVVLLVLWTVKEPPRPAAQDAVGESSMSALRGLLGRRAFVYLVTAYSLVTLVSSGVSQWTPTFLIRSYDMSLSMIGGWYGAASAFGSIIGLVGGGALANRLMRRDPRWELWTPAVTYGISIPLNVAMILAPHWWGVIAFNAIGNVFSAMGAGAALSGVQSFAEPHRRATAVSLILFLSALLGSGGGAYLIGVLADVLTPSLGVEGLRYGMLISVAMFVPGILAFLMAGVHSSRDRVA